MGDKSAADSAVSLGIAAAGGIQVFKLFRGLRHRATHPTMEDPGKDLVRRQQLAAALTAALAAIAIIGLFAWLGTIAIIPAVVIVLLAIIVSVAIALWLRLIAERRRRAVRYVICEDDYADAPRQIKSTMRRISQSARSVQDGQAHQRRMFGDLNIGEIVYGAAERAILSSELAAGARDLRPDAESTDQALLDEVNEQIRAIKDELAAVEATFKRSAKSAEDLSRQVTEPERQRAAEQARRSAASAASDRRERARTHLEELSLQARGTSAPESDNVIVRIESVAAGYDEATQVSDRVLNGLDELVNVNADAGAPTASSTRDTVAKAAKLTASAAKWSAAAAKSNSKKFRK